MNVDFLIIGQGLAGSLLGWELMQRGYRTLVIDNDRDNASRIAAGLINPVTGIRLVCNRQTAAQLTAAVEFYRQLQHQFLYPFYIEKPMLRLLRTEEERSYYYKRKQDPFYQHYLDTLLPDPNVKSGTSIISPMGILPQKQTGYVQTQPLLNSLKNYFIKNNSYRKMEFNYQDIRDLAKDKISWRGYVSKQMVFCEGHQATHNPWFSWLPFRPVKGEILTLISKTPLPDKILNYGYWLAPINRYLFRTGATFDRENINTQPTQDGRDALLKALASVCPEITTDTTISHRANIRPCTVDRNPFIGLHPKNKKIAIFNGFGSKGCLMIPYYTRQFADVLCRNGVLQQNVDIKRYEATLFPG